MNLGIDLPQKLKNKLSVMAEWHSHFFDFEPVKETPDFSSYRSELASPQEIFF